MSWEKCPNSLVAGIILIFGIFPGRPACAAITSGNPAPQVKSLDFAKQSVTAIDPLTHQIVTVAQGGNLDTWTLMAVIENQQTPLAVFEELAYRRGSIVYVGARGTVLTLPKSLAPTTADPSTLYRGRTLEETEKSKVDFLSQELLKGKADPDVAAVDAALPPLRVPTFIGTRKSDDKPTFDYGAFSDEIYVDLGKLFKPIRDARAKRELWEGIIGGYLPVNRFVFPSGDNQYWEESMFAEEPGNFWTQPIWFRVLDVEGTQLKEAHYYYHHLPFPPRGEPPASGFYKALFHVHEVWARDMNPPMKFSVPDATLRDFCLHGLLLEEITRVSDHPKYGYPPLGGINVFGGYGYNNVDTFQDTFVTSVQAFTEWGMYDVARRYIDDYFTNSVRDDGSIDTRGPEIGQYGKMLTVVAKYYAYSHDAALMRKYQKKLEAIVDLFYMLRKQSKDVPTSDISYGIIRGWSEHDSSLKIDPYRFMNPHFSNNAEAARGFHDLGEVWLEIARSTKDAHLEKVARGMLEESETMKKDMLSAIDRSIDRSKNPPYIPAVAGDKPTYGKERAYMEMMESAELTNDQVRMIINNLAANGESLFGLAHGGMYYNGFLAYGPAYARAYYDWPQEFLLLFDAYRAHIYSRGTWTSVEGAKIDGTLGGPYCTPSQVGLPVFTKWMLVLEDPDQPVVWLAKTTPRIWLEQGKKISVENAPTRFGNVGYELTSDIDHGKVSAVLHLPETYKATTKLRLRVPEGKTIQSVTLNGAKWTDFSAGDEVVNVPSKYRGTVRVEVSY